MRLAFRNSNRSLQSTASEIDVHPTRESASKPYEITTACGLLLVASMLSASFLGGYLHAVQQNGDNVVYAQLARAIEHWEFSDIRSIKQFWGLPYIAAALSMVFRFREFTSIAVLSLASTVVSALLVEKLWSKWVAMYFIVTNYTLIQFGAFGGADPLFLLLILMWLRMARRKHYATQSIVAAIATVVRPLGLFAIAASWLGAWRSGRSRTIVVAVLLTLAILSAYALPVLLHSGSALENVKGYQSDDWKGGLPITFPFGGILANLANRANIANSGMVSVKLAFVLIHVAALLGLCISPERRRRLFARPIEESQFAISYSCFIIMYNSPEWALSIYPRLLVPIAPIFLYIYEDWLPRDLRLVIALGLLAIAGAVSSNIGFQKLGTLVAIPW